MKQLSNFNKEYQRIAQNKQTDFTVGDKVKWTSHSPKGTTTKTGTIVCVVEPGDDVKNKFNEFHKYNTANQFGSARAARSYLVSVPVSAKRKPKLYFPFSNGLSKE